MGPDEQLLMQVWDESAGCEEGDVRDDREVRGDEDDDDEYFVGSWVFNMDELRHPYSQKHLVALHHEQNEHDQQNQMHSEAFSNKEVVMPETIMTVKVSHAIPLRKNHREKPTVFINVKCRDVITIP